MERAARDFHGNNACLRLQGATLTGRFLPAMRFSTPLLAGRLQRRYQRFLADVVLENGDLLTVHCPNTGSLLGCSTPGSSVWVSCTANPARRYPCTWELVRVEGGTLVGIHTGRSNGLVKEAVAEGVARELQGYDAIRQEVRYGAGKSRIDLLLTRQGGAESCFVEVKNVTAAVAEGIALFPDAVTVRGTRHLRELMGVVRDGQRAVLFFCIQRRDVREVRPADVIDPVYGRTLREALRSGVEVIAYRAEVGLGGIQLCTPVPVVCP